MFESVTATGVVTSATAWAPMISGQVLLAIGLGTMLLVAGWVTWKLARR